MEPPSLDEIVYAYATAWLTARIDSGSTRRLHARLTAEQLRVWFAPEDVDSEADGSKLDTNRPNGYIGAWQFRGGVRV